MRSQCRQVLLQAFAEPSQQGAAPASGGHEEASSADAVMPQAQVSEHLAGVVEEQAHAGIASQQQHALAHPQSANAYGAASEQAGLALSTVQGQADVQADQNQARLSSSSAFDLPSSRFNDDDPSNPDGKLMSLLMG